MHLAGIRARECRGGVNHTGSVLRLPRPMGPSGCDAARSSLTVAGAAPESPGGLSSPRLTGFPFNPTPFNVDGGHLMQAAQW